MKADKTELLPWRRTGLSGSYNKDQMTLDASSETAPNVFVIRKLRPDETNPRYYAAFHNGERISKKYHEFLIGAKAEAEAYFYTLPAFAKAGNAQALTAMIAVGKTDYVEGKSLQVGFTTYNGAARENWFKGWLQGYADQVLAQMGTGVEATTRANNMLESDLASERRRMDALILMFEFAITLNDRAAEFLTGALQLKFNPNELSERFPDWATFLASRKPATPAAE